MSLAASEVARWRDAFPVTEDHVYLNHAAIAPLPVASARAMADLGSLVSATGDRHWDARNEMTERARDLAARLLGAPRPETVAFVQSTSVGLSLVAEGLDWREGDVVVGAACEFPANVYPWKNLERRGVAYRTVPERGGRLDLDELEALVDERTRVLALSWVQYANGFQADLARLGRFCRERGVLFVVDVIQGLGSLELDVDTAGIDVAVGASHKWLLGPEGIAVLYVADRVVDRIRPVVTGWRSVEHLFDWTRLDLRWNDGALRFEPGTLNVYGLAALEKSLEMLLAVGPARIEDRILRLSGLVADGLRERGFDLVSSRHDGEASGIVTVTHSDRSAADLCDALADRGIVTAHRAGRLRIPPHFYNTETEVERLLEGVDRGVRA